MRAGVIGWPIDHSLSPRLHGYWLDQYGIDGTYEPIAIAPEDLDARMASLSGEGFRGINVTVPHKETVMASLDQIDDLARRIGAVNTIVFDESGKSSGTNTDGYGFIQNILQSQPDMDFKSGPAVVLGAGGAARAICVALMDAGVPEIRLLNRTLERAQGLASDISGPITIVDWSKRNRALGEANLVVNTTTLGMVGKPALELDLSDLADTACVTDIVYAPLETPLLKAAALRGNPVVGGIGMLLHQARPGFEAWFGHAPEVTLELRAHVLAGVGGKE